MRGKAKRSALEATYAAAVAGAGLPEPERELRPIPGRKFSFDFGWPAAMLLVEIQGGTFVQGGHVRGRRYDQDCEKLNLAVLEGYRVLWFTTDMIWDGRAVDFTTKALATGGNE